MLERTTLRYASEQVEQRSGAAPASSVMSLHIAVSVSFGSIARSFFASSVVRTTEETLARTPVCIFRRRARTRHRLLRPCSSIARSQHRK